MTTTITTQTSSHQADGNVTLAKLIPPTDMCSQFTAQARANLINAVNPS